MSVAAWLVAVALLAVGVVVWVRSAPVDPITLLVAAVTALLLALGGTS